MKREGERTRKVGFPPNRKQGNIRKEKDGSKKKLKKKQRLQLVSPKVSGIGPFVRVYGAYSFAVSFLRRLSVAECADKCILVSVGGVCVSRPGCMVLPRKIYFPQVYIHARQGLLTARRCSCVCVSTSASSTPIQLCYP